MAPLRTRRARDIGSRPRRAKRPRAQWNNPQSCRFDRAACSTDLFAIEGRDDEFDFYSWWPTESSSEGPFCHIFMAAFLEARRLAGSFGAPRRRHCLEDCPNALRPKGSCFGISASIWMAPPPPRFSAALLRPHGLPYRSRFPITPRHWEQYEKDCRTIRTPREAHPSLLGAAPPRSPRVDHCNWLALGTIAANVLPKPLRQSASRHEASLRIERSCGFRSATTLPRSIHPERLGAPNSWQGVQPPLSGRNTLEDRISKAWKAYWSQSRQFRCASAGLVPCMRLLHGGSPTLPCCGASQRLSRPKGPSTKCGTPNNKMVRKLLGLFKRLEEDWETHHERCRRSGAEASRKVRQEPWHRLLAYHHWRLLGHLAQMPVGSACYGSIREGGLWHAHTLCALRAGGGHRRPGPQRSWTMLSPGIVGTSAIGGSMS